MTEEEYDRLRDAATDHRARSVSEFARNTLLTSSQRSRMEFSWGEAVETLDERLTKVEQDVAQLQHKLTSHSSIQHNS